MDVVRVVIPRVLWGLMVCLTAVGALPRIETPPQTTTVVVRGTAILTCKVVDKGLYKVNWVKGNKIISTDGAIDPSAVPSTRYSIVGNPIQGNYNLQITGVLTSDNAPFHCQLRATSGGSNIVSDPVNLIVQHPPGEGYPQCSPDFRSTTGLTVGQQVNFICSTVRGEPAAQLNWTLDDAELSSNLDESTPGFIELNFMRNVTEEDNEKVFICTLTHLLLPEQRTCKVGPLDVIFPPVETTITTRQATPKMGETLVLICSANANPMSGIIYNWFVIPRSDEAGANQAGRIEDTSSVLILRDVANEDDGTVIVCEARNNLGARNDSFTVSVLEQTTPPPPPTPPLVPPTKRPPATSNPKSINILTAPYVIILIMIAVALLLLTIALVIFALKRKKRPASAVITIADLDNIHADVHSMASFGNISHQGTPYMDRVDYELNRSRSQSRDMFDSVSLDSASALVTRSQSQNSPTRRKYSVDSLGKPLHHNTYHHREYHASNNGSPTHRPAKRLDSSPNKERKPSDSAHSQAGRPLPKIGGPVQQNEYAELTPVSARKQYNEAQVSVPSPESGFGEDDVLIKPLNDSFPPHQSSNNCNCGRKMSYFEV